MRLFALRPIVFAGLCGLGEACLAPVPVATRSGPLAVTPPSANLTVGDVVQLTATPADEGNTPPAAATISWTSSDTNVARVTPAGLVTAVGPGSATITATSDGGEGTAAIVVLEHPPGTVDDLAVDSVTDS